MSRQDDLQTEVKVADKTHRGFRPTVKELHISEENVEHDVNSSDENISKKKKRKSEKILKEDDMAASSFTSHSRDLSISSQCEGKSNINSNLPDDLEAAPKKKRKKSKRSEKEIDEHGVNKVSDVGEDDSKTEFGNNSKIKDKITNDLTSVIKEEKTLTGINIIGQLNKK